MKSKRLLLMLLIALIAPWAAQAQTTVTIGEGTVTNNTNPIGTYYNYSITEQLYTADEIGMAGTISSISFYYMGIAAKDLPITVYMANVDAEDLSAGGISLADADEVFSGTLPVTTTAGWVTINLDAPFDYDGTSNLLIGFIKDYLYYFSGQSWQGTATTTTMARYTQSDSAGPYTTSTVPSSAQTTRPNIQMVITPSSGPTCEKPATMEVSNVTSNSATLTWTGGSGTYNVEYKGGSATDWTAYLTNTTSTSANLTGLTPGTAYQARVQSVCGDQTSGWRTSSAFSTSCGAITTFPWSEDFESYAAGDFVDPCWVNEHIEGSGSAIFKISTSTLGGNATHQLQLPDMAIGTLTKLVLPEMTLPQNYEFSIDIFRSTSTYNNNYPNEGIRVYASTNGEIEGATELAFIPRHYQVSNDVIPAEAESGWYTYELPIPMSGTCYIILRGESQYCTSTYMDNFIVKEAPACTKPTGLAASNVTAHTATISWISDADAWQICVNDDEENLIDVTETTYNFTGLAPETTYTVKVRANCGGTMSEWSNTMNFTTAVACVAPTSFTTSNVTNHGATLKWVSNADEWIVAYKVTADTVFTEITVSDTTYTFTTLEPETNYTVKVRTNCGDEDGMSAWTTTRTFTTLVACPAPNNLTCTALTLTDATLDWNERGDATEWELQYWMVGADTTLVTVTEKPYTLTNLITENVYGARVRSACGSDWSSTITFEPTAKLVIGSGTSTSGYLPTNTNYKYSYTQQIYTVEELGEAGVFESIDFYMTSTNAYTRNLDIYMVSTDKNAFENNSDWITVTAADLVFSGEVNFAPASWTSITLDNAFIYDGTQNVAIIVDDNTGVWSSRYFRTFTASANQSHYCYQDSSDIDPSAPSASNNNITTSKNQIRILKTEMSSCMKPMHLTATEVGPNFAKLSWTENGETEQWTVVCNSVNYEASTNEDFMLEGLEPNTEYTIYVYPNCDPNLHSDAITITTLVACPAPENIVVSDVTYNAATVAWVGYNDSYIVQLGQDGEPITLLNVNFEDQTIPVDWTNTATADTLVWMVVTDTIHNSYYMKSGNAGTSNSTSAISVTVTFPSNGTIEFDAECRGEGTSTYYDHCDFTIDGVRVLYHGADLTSDGWLHYSFEVAAGEHTFTWSYTKDSSVNPAGDYFAVDNIVMSSNQFIWDEPVAVENTEYTFTNLTPETKYYVRVIGVCDGEQSEASEIVTFTTLEQTTLTQTIALAVGTNWVSFGVEITLNDLKAALLEAVPGTAIKITGQSNSTNYDPARNRWLGTLTWDAAKMYMIKVTASCEIAFEGMPIEPADRPVTIVNGNNYLGFPLSQNMSLTNAFAGFAVNGDKVFGQTGSSTYTRGRWQGSTLTELQPGKGYIYKSVVSESRTLVFPVSSK